MEHSGVVCPISGLTLPSAADAGAHQWDRSPAGLYLPSHVQRQRRRPIAIDFFCGCGGMSLGLIQGGFEVVCGCDFDVTAMATYLANLGTYPVDLWFLTPEDGDRAERTLRAEYKRSGWLRGKRDRQDGQWTDAYGRGPLVSGQYRPQEQPGVPHFVLGDVRRLDGRALLDRLGLRPGDVDLVAGGPPCQGFSRAGKRDVMDPRNSLVFEWARLVLEIRPKAIVMENVPDLANMVTPEGLPVLDALCRVLEDASFAGFDALKRSLLASSGVGAALRSRGLDDAKGGPAKASELKRQETNLPLFAALEQAS